MEAVEASKEVSEASVEAVEASVEEVEASMQASTNFHYKNNNAEDRPGRGVCAHRCPTRFFCTFMKSFVPVAFDGRNCAAIAVLSICFAII